MKHLLRRLFLLFLVLVVLFSAMVIPSAAYPLRIGVSAEAAVLMNGNTGEILFAQNENTVLPMASTTKIMTAVVVLEALDLSKIIKVPKEAVGAEGSSVYLCEGEELSVENLLYALLLESANDAAEALAIAASGSIPAFVAEMNRKAGELSLDGTSFANPHGLPAENHYTTARDLAVLTRYALRNEVFAAIVSTYRAEIPMRPNNSCRSLVNHNRLLRTYDGCVGVKTGYTKKSGRCLVSAAKRDGLFLIAVTLNAPDDWQDHRNMLDAGFSSYSHYIFNNGEKYSGTVPVVGGTAETAPYHADGISYLDLPKGEHSITAVTELPRFVFAPVKQGEKVGRIVYYENGIVLGEVPLYAAENISKRTEKRSFLKWLLSLFRF